MGVSKGERFAKEDIFVDYDFEQVMFRWDHLKKLNYRKFYGRTEHLEPVPQANRLLNDAFLFGDEITKDEYLRGKNAQ
jgi:hypothetical protein